MEILRPFRYETLESYFFISESRFRYFSLFYFTTSSGVWQSTEVQRLYLAYVLEMNKNGIVLIRQFLPCQVEACKIKQRNMPKSTFRNEKIFFDKNFFCLSSQLGRNKIKTEYPEKLVSITKKRESRDFQFWDFSVYKSQNYEIWDSGKNHSVATSDL